MWCSFNSGEQAVGEKMITNLSEYLTEYRFSANEPKKAKANIIQLDGMDCILCMPYLISLFQQNPNSYG